MFTNFDTFLLSLLNCLVLYTFSEEPSPSNSLNTTSTSAQAGVGTRGITQASACIEEHMAPVLDPKWLF